MPKRKKIEAADSYLSRLEKQNRSALKNTPMMEFQGNSNRSRIDRNESISEPTLMITGNKVEYMSIDEAVPGQVTTEDDGDFLLIKQRFRDLRPDAMKTINCFPVRLKNIQIQHLRITNPVFETLKTVHPSKILFLDIE
ncbi:hypothetical protein IIB79_04685, partial [candidate division KSB1 bacterium]|nr:hypothetical protein [candidate division KSB1 bacterium]